MPERSTLRGITVAGGFRDHGHNSGSLCILTYSCSKGDYQGVKVKTTRIIDSVDVVRRSRPRFCLVEYRLRLKAKVGDSLTVVHG